MGASDVYLGSPTHEIVEDLFQDFFNVAHINLRYSAKYQLPQLTIEGLTKEDRSYAAGLHTLRSFTKTNIQNSLIRNFRIQMPKISRRVRVRPSSEAERRLFHWLKEQAKNEL